MKTTRILRLILLGTLSFSILSCSESNTENQNQETVTSNPERPNFLIILTDDQGYADVTSFGSTDLKTPYIDDLVTSGVKMDNFYANCPVCSPTRAALLSGRFQDYVGVPGVIRTNEENSWGYLDPEAKLISEVLQENDYHTAIVGKWHLGLESPNIPNERGFDHFHGFLGDMMDDYWDHRRLGNNYMRINQEEIDPEGHATDLFTQYAIDYLDSRVGAEEPFFLYLAYNAPHFPVQPPEDWLAKVFEREPGIDSTRAKLVAFIEHMDDGIGKVVEALRQNGQYENTMIFFTSDNGGHLPSKANNGPWRDGKQSVYEGGLRVPACVVWPGHISPGTDSEQIALTMDIYPTILDAAGISYDHYIEGESFLTALSGDEIDFSNRPLFFTRREGGTRYGGLTIQAVRLGDWKLLQNSPFEPQELYNLAEDPTEENNLIDQEEEIYRKLNNLMMHHLQKGGAVPWQVPGKVNEKIEVK